MKKLFLLFAVVFAIGCGDNSVEEPSYNVREILNGRQGCVWFESVNETVALTLITGDTFLRVDSINSPRIDTNITKKIIGTYTGSYIKNSFTGSFINSNNTKQTISITITSEKPRDFNGEFEEIVSDETVKSKFRAANCQ